jgi:hypothetical protein
MVYLKYVHVHDDRDVPMLAEIGRIRSQRVIRLTEARQGKDGLCHRLRGISTTDAERVLAELKISVDVSRVVRGASTRAASRES